MSLTPEQIEKEREAFENHMNEDYLTVDVPDILLKRDNGEYFYDSVRNEWHGYLARAEIAEAEREQLTNELLRLREVVCEQDAESIDAILAPREKGGETK